MLTAYAKFDIRTGRTTAFSAHIDQGTNTFAVNRHERIDRINLGLGIMMQKRASIIAANAQCGLG